MDGGVTLAKYVSVKEKSSFYDDYPMLPNLWVDEPRPIRFTGLLDSEGNEIWELPPPIGFGRDNEW